MPPRPGGVQLVGVAGAAPQTLAPLETQEASADSAARECTAFCALIENALDLVAILDADGTTRYAGPSDGRVLGVSAGELVVPKAGATHTQRPQPHNIEVPVPRRRIVEAHHFRRALTIALRWRVSFVNEDNTGRRIPTTHYDCFSGILIQQGAKVVHADR